jgi:hypothetical protein
MTTEKKEKVEKKNDPKYCITPEFRASFPHVFKPYKNEESGEGKFQITMLFPKSTDLKAMKTACVAAAVEKWGADKAKWPKNLRLPFRDGNEKADRDGYEGMIFVAATSKTRPNVVDGKRSPITEEDGSFYAGCFGRASLRAFAYNTKGNVGISFGLQNIQKLRDGEPFSGRKRPEEDFDEVDDGSDDPASYSVDDGLGL